MQIKSILSEKINAKQTLEDIQDFLKNNNNVLKHKKNDNIYFFEGHEQVYLFYFKKGEEEEETFALYYQDKDNSTKTGLALFKDRFSFELPYLEKGDNAHVGDKLIELSRKKETMTSLLREMTDLAIDMSDEEFDKLYKKLRQQLKDNEDKPGELKVERTHAMTHNYMGLIEDLNPLLKHPIINYQDLLDNNTDMAKQVSPQSTQMTMELNFLNEMCLKNSIFGKKKAIVFNDLDNAFYVDKKSLYLVFTSQNADFVAVQENEKNWKIYSSGMYDVFSEAKNIIPLIHEKENDADFNLKCLVAQIKEGEIIYMNSWSDYMMSCLNFSAQEAESEFKEEMTYPVNLASVDYQLTYLFNYSQSGLWKTKADIYNYVFATMGTGYYVNTNGELTSDTKYLPEIAKKMHTTVATIPLGEVADLVMLEEDVLEQFKIKISPDWKECLKEYVQMLNEFKDKGNFIDSQRVTKEEIEKWVEKAQTIIDAKPTNKAKVK